MVPTYLRKLNCCALLDIEYLEDEPEEEGLFFVTGAPNRSTSAEGGDLPVSLPPFEDTQSLDIPLEVEHELLVRKTYAL